MFSSGGPSVRFLTRYDGEVTYREELAIRNISQSCKYFFHVFGFIH